MPKLTPEQKNKKVKVKKEVVTPVFEETSVQEIDDRIADLVQHIANTQAEIDTLEASKKLVEKEAIK